MVTLKQAEEIVSLHSQLKSVNERLAEIEAARENGTSITVYFKNKNPENRWGDVDGLKYARTFQQAGELNNIASIVLARLSDEVAAQKRKIERRLDDLGALRP